LTDQLDHLASVLADRYKIERRLGEGGMATVYLAEDVKHDRKVALKVLKPELAAVLGADRFVQEIKTTASLQHPNILPLFDSGEVEGFLYYVMPYIEGETLREKLNRETQLGIDEAVKIATEVADALDAAHQRGVIHRDIKPENILLHSGRPMVADFGIALAVSAAAGGRMTETGLSLGTPHYMSPEQATAEKDITHRSDVYSLGSVLYEMLTGEPPYMGNSAQQIIMKIVTDTPRPVTELRRSVPPNVTATVAKSLEKLAADRFESAAKFAAALSNPAFTVPTTHTTATTPREAPAPRARDWRSIAAVAAVAFALGALMWQVVGPGGSPDRRTMRFARTPSVALFSDPSGILAISPDGSRTAFVGIGPDGQQLFVHDLDQLDTRPVPGTTGAEEPHFSPDGQWIAFLDNVRLRRVPAAGGASVTVANVSGIQRGVSWAEDDVIIVSPVSIGGLLRVTVSTGVVDTLVWPERDSEIATYRWPELLPGGRTVLFATGDAIESMRIMAYDIESGEVTYLLDGTRPRYSRTGHLVYVTSNGTLSVVPFDAARLSVGGSPSVIAQGVMVKSAGGAEYDVSDEGSLVYIHGGADASQLVMVDRRGAEELVSEESRNFAGVALSPDGDRLALTIVDEAATDVWLYDMSLETFSPRTFGGENVYPSWSRDGNHIVFSSDRSGRGRGLWRVRADGSGQPEPVYDVDSEQSVYEGVWSPDGEWFVFRYSGVTTSRDIMGFAVDGDSTPIPLVRTEFGERAPALSPDGRWLAYSSDESGQSEVYVQEFPGPGGKWLVSDQGGTEPRWSRDGRELFFRTSTHFMSAVVQTTPVFRLLELRELFPDSYLRQVQNRRYDVHPDGNHFLMVRGTHAAEIVQVVNWLGDVR
jgi:serine/threonine-protein kinase